MPTISKKEVMDKWLESNPGKTERDWLLEVRCTTDVQHDTINEILDSCDSNGIPYEIGLTVNIPEEYDHYIAAHQDEVNEIIGLYQKHNLGKAQIDFNSLNSERSSNNKEKFIITKSFDLYFPSVGWCINIGEEIDNAVDSILPVDWWSEGEGSNFASIYLLQSLVNGFHWHLKNKYKLPMKERKYDRPILLPWNRDIVKSESIKKYRNLPFDIGYVYDFMKELFKDDFDGARGIRHQIISKRKERFLSSHIDIQEKRVELLHSLVIEMQKSTGTQECLSTDEIEELLETVDNELSLLYPEYGQLKNL